MDRILAVDDDVGLTELLAEYLRPEGFTLEAVHDGNIGGTETATGLRDYLRTQVLGNRHSSLPSRTGLANL
jgi:two-component system response regulator CpxR